MAKPKSLRFLVSGLRARRLRRPASACLVFSFFYLFIYFIIYLFIFRCETIATNMAGSIGILPHCVLNHIGAWTFARFARPLLATILCVWEIWSGSSNRVYMFNVFHWLAKKTLTKTLSCSRTLEIILLISSTEICKGMFDTIIIFTSPNRFYGKPETFASF